MNKELIRIPSLGGAERLEVLEICVRPGDRVKTDGILVALVSDTASMEVPSTRVGKIVELRLKVGDSVSEGDAIAVIETGDEPVAAVDLAEGKLTSRASQTAAPQTITVPDIVGDEDFDVAKICVTTGSAVGEGDLLVVLESDTASLDVPAPGAGIVLALKVRQGEKIRKGSAILELGQSGDLPRPSPSALPQPAVAPEGERNQTLEEVDTRSAGPAVRKLAREFGIDLLKVEASGSKGQILREDLQKFVSDRIQGDSALAARAPATPSVPEVDFAAFGAINIEPMSTLHKMTAANLRSSWLNVPHVTQFDDADTTGLEELRASLKSEAESRGVKLTPLPFLLKACAAALQVHPKINASLLPDGARIVRKQYVHIGIAVDTTAGLVVPVVRDVDKKSVWDLAAETAELAAKAKNRKLSLLEMQGGCFTISSLGNIGGLGFTPIVNTPEVAILGVSRLTVKPAWNGIEFVPRKMLPLSLSYDHRAINGADAGKFLTQLGELLADSRHWASENR